MLQPDGPHFARLFRLAFAAGAGLALCACVAGPEPIGPNFAPTATIAAPTSATTFKGGDSISYSGSAIDQEDGNEPASRLTWWVELHHDTHTHPFMPRTTGATGKLFVPPVGETSDNVFLRIYLEAMDDSGSADTVTRDVLPEKVQFTIATSPAGLAVTLDGQPQVGPVTITGVVGMERELGVTTPQTVGAAVYSFSSWSDGGAATHRIATPATAATYTAQFGIPVNRPPTISLTAPGNGFSVTVNTPLTLSANASDPDGSVDKVGFYDGAVLIGEDRTAPYSWSWAPTSTGAHAITARVTDNQGATATTTAANGTATTALNLPPTATLTAPANNATLVTGVAITLTATASDPNGSVAKVEFFDGSTLLGEDTTSPYSLSWTPTAASAGTRSLAARATDNLGSVGTSSQVSVIVNLPPNVNPTAALTAPANGATLLTGTATNLTATASDADGSVTSVAFYDGSTLLGTDTSAPYSFSWTPAATGSHALTARATDNRGGTGTSASVTVTVNGSGPDTQAPTLTLTSPTAQQTGITGSPTFTVTTSDNVGVTAVDYQVDGDAVGTASSSPWSFTLPAASAYTTGVHLVRARARDAAGNQSAWSAARVAFGGSTDLPSGFTRSVYVSVLNYTGTAMAWSPDGRLFICEQGGSLRVVKNGSLLNTPFVTVTTSANGERGLLGVAFHPNFASNGYVYLYYTTTSGGTHNRVSRFTASGDVAASGSEVPIIELPALTSATNHNGGALHFGPDGKLYVAVGENATPSSAPLLTTVFGKMLRFNDDGTIPSDNPFVGSTSGINQSIWARGLRNPFTFAFDPGTGLMFINDVGQDTWEEVNPGQAGANYGWPSSEGSTSISGQTSPLFTYAHRSNSTLVTGSAIAGAAFYRPSTVLFPSAWVGDYFFGDYVSGWVNRMDVGNGNAIYAFARIGSSMSDVQVGPDGALYVLAEWDRAHWGVLRYGR